MRKTTKVLSVALSLTMAASAITFSASASAADTEKSTPGFSWDNASVYFLLTDRFKNGNPDNDHSYERGLNPDGSDATSQMVTDAATFHGGDFAGITQAIEEGYFEDLGINALWITAPYEQSHGYSVGGDQAASYPHYAYHGYYVLDYTNTDANFGTKEEFKTLVDTAHEHGLRVVMDVVMNHAGYNNMHDMDKYGYGTLKTGALDVYYRWDKISNAAFDRVIDYKSSASDWAKWWGSDWVRAGIAGYTPGGTDDLTTSVSYLPDFKTESTKEVDIPELLKTKWSQEKTLEDKTAAADAWFAKTGNAKTVRNYIVFWLSSWVREFGVDGFRCDTAKHVELASWNALKTECVKALKEWKSENPNKALDDEEFWMVGENWDTSQTLNDNEYFSEGGFDSMINFDYGAAKGLPTVDSINETYQTYADYINTKDNFNMLTYISSHDDKLYRKDLIYQGSALALLPGGIQIYYGDETKRPTLKVKINNRTYDIGNHAYRSDMNWDSINTEVQAHWQKTLTFRNNHIAVGAGSHTIVESTEGAAFVREYDKDGVTDKIAACLAENANTPVTINVGSAFADGTILENTYDGTLVRVADGKVTFNSGENKTILLEVSDAETITGIYGDANMDGTVDLKDILAMQKHMAELVTLSNDAAKLADVNIDDSIDLYDIVNIQKYMAEIPTENVGKTVEL